MRSLWWVCVSLTALCGCSTGDGKAGRPTKPKPDPKIDVSPSFAIVGKILSVNAGLRFAVLDFPPGVMPAVSQRLSVYRTGQKVGEVKVSGPQRDTSIVADVTAGEAQVGDEVRTD